MKFTWNLIMSGNVSGRVLISEFSPATRGYYYTEIAHKLQMILRLTYVSTYILASRYNYSNVLFLSIFHVILCFLILFEAILLPDLSAFDCDFVTFPSPLGTVNLNFFTGLAVPCQLLRSLHYSGHSQIVLGRST